MRQASETEALAVSISQEVGRKLRRVTTAGAIYERLYADIVSLRMAPGLLLQEKRIAEDFGVSRTPVREALLRLSEGGPVAAIPEAVVVRKALEGATVETAAQTATAADIAVLDAIIGRQRSHAAVGNVSNFHEEDEAFHEAIAQISGYPGIWAILKTVKVQIDRARRLALPALGRMDNVVCEHTAIRDALASHDAAAARAAMIHHLSAVIPDVNELRSRYPDYFC